MGADRWIVDLVGTRRDFFAYSIDVSPHNYIQFSSGVFSVVGVSGKLSYDGGTSRLATYDTTWHEYAWTSDIPSISGLLVASNDLSDVASAIASIDNISKISTPIVAATTTDLTTATGNSVSIVGGGGGPATITSLGNGAPGIRRVTAFAAICTLVHNPTSMDLITSADITAAVGDRCEWVAVGSNQWLMLSYDRADGTPLVGGGGTGADFLMHTISGGSL